VYLKLASTEMVKLVITEEFTKRSSRQKKNNKAK
jgi:hypothetical protein